ncbi:MAG: hypothetical protein E7397_01160 [Ruminococcaceae bacterium]|nr:hypothetical protein [Oscillospiraceae bacterium]
MAAVKKEKVFTYKEKPVYRKGNTIYYGDLNEPLILVLEIVETEKLGEFEISKKVKFHVRDNTGEEIGVGMNHRSGEREDLFSAFDMGAWWLQDALELYHNTMG